MTKAGQNVGVVYMFERSDGGSWTQVARLTVPEGETRYSFGNALALRERPWSSATTTIAILAPVPAPCTFSSAMPGEQDTGALLISSGRPMERD